LKMTMSNTLPRIMKNAKVLKLSKMNPYKVIEKPGIRTKPMRTRIMHKISRMMKNLIRARKVLKMFLRKQIGRLAKTNLTPNKWSYKNRVGAMMKICFKI
jgi:hypothetical protein